MRTLKTDKSLGLIWRATVIFGVWGQLAGILEAFTSGASAIEMAKVAVEKAMSFLAGLLVCFLLLAFSLDL